MKLSEAMMLGSTTCKMEAGNWDSCALGCAGNAVGIEQTKYPVNSLLPDGVTPPWKAIYNQWPWLEQNREDSSPVNYVMPNGTFETRINYLNCEFLPAATHIYNRFDSMVCKGLMTLEQLVDYVRSIEPECGDCNRFDCLCVQKMGNPQPVENLTTV
jgi:hypothetical protein